MTWILSSPFRGYNGLVKGIKIYKGLKTADWANNFKNNALGQGGPSSLALVKGGVDAGFVGLDLQSAGRGGHDEQLLKGGTCDGGCQVAQAEDGEARRQLGRLAGAESVPCERAIREEKDHDAFVDGDGLTRMVTQVETVPRPAGGPPGLGAQIGGAVTLVEGVYGDEDANVGAADSHGYGATHQSSHGANANLANQNLGIDSLGKENC
ncbi:hypothetical protein HN51_026351 [Arachis hypogaea]